MTALPPPSPVASPTQEQLAASLKNSSTDVALAKLLSLPGNDRCAECDTPEPRWASWNLGVFICTRCSGVHRSLGTHISKVRSVNLDTWTPEQIQSMRDMGNVKAAAFYMAFSPPDYVKPNLAVDAALQVFIRSKYERKLFVDPMLSSEAQTTMAEYMDVYVSQPETDWDLLNNGRDKFTSYLVTVSTNMESFQSKHFSIRRRYNDFYTLFNELQVNPATKAIKLPEFPPKTYLRSESRFSAITIELRRNGFEKLLNTIAASAVLRNAPSLRKFLLEAGTTASTPMTPGSPAPASTFAPPAANDDDDDDE